MNRKEALAAVLLGTAVGDALGLPAEGMSRAVIQRRWHGDWRMRMILGRGMVSDDTEHAAMTVLALHEQPEDADLFQRVLARRLRWWFAALPPATGLATARACVKLWLGISPQRSGVFSAGNGPCMRSAVIGAWHAEDEERRRAFVRASTRLTHTDPRAEAAAQAVALGAAMALRKEGAPDVVLFLDELRELSADEEWALICQRMKEAWNQQSSMREFAKVLGLQCGVTGYAYHTVPVALFAWLRHAGDFRTALTSVLDCGGDTDTVGAITGALAALSAGVETIPTEWMGHIVDWPLSIAALRRAASGSSRNGVGSALVWPLALARNMVFLVLVLVHGFRRLIPC
jgi:ADP-ribosylglycohydrolase